MYSCDGKAEFSASSHQPSVSYDPSEIVVLSMLKMFLWKQEANLYVYIFL